MDNEIEEKGQIDIFEEEDIGIEEQSPQNEVYFERGIKLPLGMALSDEGLYQLSSREKIDLICIMGPVGSGKTTFEAMLYSLFLRQVNEEIIFSGSDTIAGFEGLLNHIRVNSGKSNVDMPRTPKESREQYYHLKLYVNSLNEKRNIVFADVSGELFDLCKANRENLDMYVQHLTISKNIVIFIDGEDTLNSASWNVAIMNTKHMLMTIKSSKQYKPGMNIDIVISKNDRIVEKSDDERVKKKIQFIDSYFESLKKDFKINFFRIQALNDYKQIDTSSTSLTELLKYWLIEKNDIRDQKTDQCRELHVTSCFNKFMERQSYE